MPTDKRDGSSSMDGVPVKISEKYKRKPKIRIPVSCQNCTPGPSLAQDYNFRLERGVLTKLEEWKKIRDERTADLEAKAKQWNQFEEEIDKLNKLSLESLKVSEDSTNDLIEGNNILNTTKTVKEAAKPTVNNNQSSFKISEFETDISSPFDNMELKTINEMEVLASVLSSSQPRATPCDVPSIPKTNGAAWNTWHDYPSYSSPPQYYEPSASHYTMYPSSLYNAEPLSHSQWMGASYIPPMYSSPMAAARTTVNTMPYASSVGSDVHSGLYPLQTYKSNSKSVPDLVMELEKEIKENKQYEQPKRKTKTPPPRPAASSVGLEDWTPWPDIESPRHSADNVLALTVPPLARNISEMGFPVDRVVRSLDKFQNDDKKVIEFLLLVQRLEEKKFKGDLVERSLHANNYDEKEAEKHLQAVTVLLDLGFDINSVEKALLESKNDRDVALELLIS